MTSRSPLHRLPDRLRRYLKEQGWQRLSDIQRVAFPVILDGRDATLEAPTAGGKTEAVLLPLLTRLLRDPRDPDAGVRVLYLAPLRALLNDLDQRVRPLAEACGLRAFKWHGDVARSEKVSAFEDPPDILLTTPESLEAMLLRKDRWRRFFASLEVTVVDEAHSFAAGDRGAHLAFLMERLEAGIGNAPQRVAMTATIGNPDELGRWLVGNRRAPPQRLRVDGAPGAPRDYFVEAFEDDDEAPAQERGAWLHFQALHRAVYGKRALVFARSRSRAEQIARSFGAASEAGALPAVRVATHHSAVSRYFREEAERLIRLRRRGLEAIISTSTLELGIDIGALDTVVQVDTLTSPSSFLQRVGRTGRRPGQPQVFRGLIFSDEDSLLLLAATVNLGSTARIEAISFPRCAWHIIAHQLICLSLQEYGVSRERAWDVLQRAQPASGIRRSELKALVDHMIEEEFLREADDLLLVGREGEKRFLAANWKRLFAVFEAGPLYEVYAGKAQVGTLDARFVEGLEPPFHFALGGKTWRARRVDRRTRRVQAEGASAGTPPRWHSFGGMDVPLATAEEVGRICCQGEGTLDFLGPGARALIEGARFRFENLPWTPERILLDCSPGGQANLWTWAGDRVNRTLARLLGGGERGRATSRYDRVTLCARGVEGEAFVRSIRQRFEDLRRSEPDRLRAEARRLVRPWPFSPFSRCLPGDLHCDALVERALDIGGTLERMRRGPLCTLREVESV